jgi:hypothetical protein
MLRNIGAGQLFSEFLKQNLGRPTRPTGLVLNSPSGTGGGEILNIAGSRGSALWSVGGRG